MTNSGPPVPAAELERIVQSFRRLDADADGRDGGLGLGLGLGLAIVQAIATAHGATLLVRAQPRGGLQVEVSFPAVAAAAGDRAAS